MTEDTTRTPLTEEQKQRRRVGRKLGFTYFTAQYRMDNPGAAKDDLRAAWKEVKKTQTKVAMRALRQLERAGYVITPPEAEAEAAE